MAGGQNGGLGHGNEHNVKIPRVVELEESHKSSHTVCCGLKHRLKITRYTVGLWKPGSLGLCHRKTRALRRQDVLRPERVSFLDSYRTKLMSAGAHHSIFLVGGHGYALSCGYGENGQLGRKVQGSDVTPKPVEMPQGEAISHVASGYSHTLVLCQNNHVYAFGSNEYGQLGLSNRHSKLKPTRLVTLSNIQICALYAGYHHSCAIKRRWICRHVGTKLSIQLWHWHDKGNDRYLGAENNRESSRCSRSASSFLSLELHNRSMTALLQDQKKVDRNK